jgi:hypothetical protein
VFPSLSVSLDYVHAMGRDQFMQRDLNPQTRANTSRTGTITRRDPTRAGVFTYINAGRTTYDALAVQLDKRESHNVRFRVSYTYSKSRGNTSGNGAPLSPFQFQDELNLDQNQGPTDFDRRHNFVFSGAMRVPKTGGLTVATVIRALSGLPFTVQDTNFDLDRNGLAPDPLPAGSYSGTGANVITVESNGGRNGAVGPSFFQADIRLGYNIKVGGRQVELFGEVFNLTDHVNYANPTGDRRSTDFLRLVALRPGGAPRTGQFGARFVF